MSGRKSTSLSDPPRRRNHHSDTDISDLPDSIIGHILSHLPTKNAVATSILSTRWKLLWTTAFNLDFCCPQNYTGAVEQFVQFVNYVLLFHRPGFINKLSLTWKTGCIPFYVNTWIRCVVARDVHELYVCVEISTLPIPVQSYLFSNERLQSLELNCRICISSEIVFSLPKLERLKLISIAFEGEKAFCNLLDGCPMLKCLVIHMDIERLLEISTLPIQVQSYLFSNERLQSLELNCGIRISSEIVFSLPKLECLKLISIAFEGEKAFCSLLDGCPMLKCLVIHMDIERLLEIDDFSSFKFIISSASLRSLELYAYDGDPTLGWTIFCDVQLDAPSLRYIKLEDRIYNIFVPQRLVFLDEAVIRASEDVNEDEMYCDSLVEAFHAFGCAKTLTLSVQVTRALSRSTIKMETEFNKLTRLEVIIDWQYWSSLLDFIKLSDNLEVLLINKHRGNYTNEFHVDNSSWKKPDLVPRCLSNSLKTVSIGAYDGYPDELAMVDYILSHGSVLEAMQICFGESITYSERKYELFQKISESPRKSRICKVKFCDRDYQHNAL